jgi:hypothetical protein
VADLRRSAPKSPVPQIESRSGALAWCATPT